MAFVQMQLSEMARKSPAELPLEVQGEHGRGKVLGALSGHELGLANGEIVRLAMVRAPKAVSDFDDFAVEGAVAGRKNHDQAAQEAQNLLETVCAGREVGIFPLTRGRDRHGRLLAHILVEGVWLQELLVRAGWARVEVFSDSSEDACAQLFDAEANARARRSGVWAIKAFKVISAREQRTLEAVANDPVAARMAILEGVVNTVAPRRGGVQISLAGGAGADVLVEAGRKVASLDLKRGDLVEIRGRLAFSSPNKINVTKCGHLGILARL